MIIFTSKAYNILSLISIAKTTLTDKTVCTSFVGYNVLQLSCPIFSLSLLSTYFLVVFYKIKNHSFVSLIVFHASFQVDPFLQLVNDSKLQATVDTSGQPSKAYGSKEDDEDALKSLSSIKLTESQSNESFVTMILQNLEEPLNVTSIYIYLSFNVALVYQDQCINLQLFV